MLLQTDTAATLSATEIILSSGPETFVVLALTAVLSLASWFVVGLKWWQFRRLSEQSRRFFAELERTTGLRDAYRAVMKLPPSPYNRLFREGITFYSELHPGALGEAEPTTYSLSDAQLEALKMVLAKEIAAERDGFAHYVPWLATIGAVSPLLGLLGTVLGVMDAFLGIAARGSGNLSAVAPGVAEALVTTVAGLAVAIPSVMAYNYFAGRVGRLEGELEGFGNELVGWMAREGLL
ncbi:MAG TPA: MotA/TolQ/ExbB proton channel family protein [Gemmatimonadales bacterium]|nr:MotA/TolQ/ExbB proton channel family protein [Gemmatimonadales bacterium]